MSFFLIIIIKEILERNVAFTSFVGKIATILQEGKMGVIERTTLALEEECDDLVGAAGGS
jgi:hypothetical protein